MKFNTKFVLTYVFLSIAYLVVAGSFVSCGMTPKRQAFVSVQAATDSAETIGDLYRAGLITQAQLQHLLPFADAVFAAQKELLQAQQRGETDLSTYTTALNSAVITLLNEKAKVQK